MAQDENLSGRMVDLLEAQRTLDEAAVRWRELVAETAVELQLAGAETLPLPGYGQVSVRHPEPEYHIDDPEKLHGWVAANYPEELEIIVRVRPRFFDALAAQGSVLREQDQYGILVDPAGNLVPGVRVRIPDPDLQFSHGAAEGDGAGEPEDDQDVVS